MCIILSDIRLGQVVLSHLANESRSGWLATPVDHFVLFFHSSVIWIENLLAWSQVPRCNWPGSISWLWVKGNVINSFWVSGTHVAMNTSVRAAINVSMSLYPHALIELWQECIELRGLSFKWSENHTLYPSNFVSKWTRARTHSWFEFIDVSVIHRYVHSYSRTTGFLSLYYTYFTP